MTQIDSGLRSVLSLPAAYRLFTRLVGARSARTEIVRRYLRPRAGDRVVDIGCGPGDLIDFLPGCEYLGFDASAEYIAFARARHGDRGRFLTLKVGEAAALPVGSFDLAVAYGVLHHLDDPEADLLFAEARALLAPGGRLVTVDGGWAEDQGRLARFMVSRDRGQSIRTAERLREIAARHFGAVEAHIRHDLLRLPYTHLVLECSG
ncbi:MAG TPA: class I SAM-dependent methyltransferase [Thermoanaerobaculia bacterium]|nr:class I SAM-dependent methyltransferase [Thermoanaerobaculia bacterium]